jgi:hypothetical protein
VSRAADASRAQIDALIRDLESLREMPALERVRLLGVWGATSGAVESIRTRLVAVRALSALEADESRPDGVTQSAWLGLGSTSTSDLTKLGRRLLSAAARDAA